MKSGFFTDTVSRTEPAPVRGEGDVVAELERRVSRSWLAERLEREARYERHVHGLSARFFHIDSWHSVHAVIRNSLRLVGLHERARRNARALRVVRNDVFLRDLPPAFDGYTILQISDPHVDLGPDIPRALIGAIEPLQYDVCALTGDYRTRTFGPYQPTLDAIASIRPHLKAPVYAVLGNHDTIRMVPHLERLGIRVLLNESIVLERGGASVYLGGIDDAHQYRMHDCQKASASVPPGALSILLSHTPEAYRDAAAAGFRFMLCGHTHGGQICLPGGFPLIIDADCPRRYAKGYWRHERLTGYTSVGSGTSIVDVRLNCPPEVTLHRLRAGGA